MPPDRRRQSLSQDDCVTFAMLQTIDAELASLRRHRGRRRARYGNERCEVDLAAREGVRKLEADARRRGIGIDLHVGDAKAVFGAQPFIGCPHRRIVANFQVLAA